MSETPDSVLSTSDRRQFTIRACLGRGGFGEVYRASMTNATGLEADVALKVLHNDLDVDSQAVQRLRDEGRMLGALVHPSIVRVYDLVILEGRVGLVTEFVEGADLADCIRGNDTMPPRAVAEVIGRVADALTAAWETPTPGSDRPLHLIHRDVKPANIRIGIEGAVKLLDFGVAHSSRLNREAHTNTGHMVGSYLYMAPECLQENTFSRASDIFALGATMYESLSGQRLFPDQSLRELYVLVLKDDAYEAYIEERLAGLEIPAPMRELLRSMLARLPQDRPDSSQVSTRCDDLVDGMQGDNLRRWCKSRDWPAAAVIPGMLDGRTLTEATMVSRLHPSFSHVPPLKAQPRRRWLDWGTVFAGMGGLAMITGLLLAVIAVSIVVVVLMRQNGMGGRLIRAPEAPEIPVYEPGEQLEPNRVQEGKLEPEPAPSITIAQPAPTWTSVLTVQILPRASSGKARLTSNGKHYYNLDQVPYGKYTIWADFGKGFERKQEVTVNAPNVTITCNAYKRICW